MGEKAEEDALKDLWQLSGVPRGWSETRVQAEVAKMGWQAEVAFARESPASRFKTWFLKASSGPAKSYLQHMEGLAYASKAPPRKQQQSTQPQQIWKPQPRSQRSQVQWPRSWAEAVAAGPSTSATPPVEPDSNRGVKRTSEENGSVPMQVTAAPSLLAPASPQLPSHQSPPAPQPAVDIEAIMAQLATMLTQQLQPVQNQIQVLQAEIAQIRQNEDGEINGTDPCLGPDAGNTKWKPNAAERASPY